MSITSVVSQRSSEESEIQMKRWNFTNDTISIPDPRASLKIFAENLSRRGCAREFPHQVHCSRLNITRRHEITLGRPPPDRLANSAGPIFYASLDTFPKIAPKSGSTTREHVSLPDFFPSISWREHFATFSMSTRALRGLKVVTYFYFLIIPLVDCSRLGSVILITIKVLRSLDFFFCWYSRYFL